MNNLVVLLGAGFSSPAGLPLAKDINKRFNRVQKEKLLAVSSGEWMWIDNKSEITVHNGRLSCDCLAYSYILNEIVNTYNKEVDNFGNYEVFFSYVVLDKFYDIDWFKLLYDRAKEELIKDTPYLIDQPELHSSYLLPFTNDPDIGKIQNIFNYLIGDMLFVSNSTVDNSLSEYEKFINFLLTFERVDIFTLNHDLLLEKMLTKKKIPFFRGFSCDNSDVFYENSALPIFNNSFEDKINIHKLHGSVDFFKFQHFENDGGLFWKPTQKYNYFTTHNHIEKHDARRVNPITGETLQKINFDITPKFITGTEKASIISNDMMYSRLFENFKNSIVSPSKVFISGYSYRDKHINKELKKRKDLEIINQNPNDNYPFNAKKIKEIKTLNDL